jgi:hypothetical protein
LYFDFASNFGISSMVIPRGGTGSGSSSMVWGIGQVAKARSRLGDALRTRECCRSGEGGAKRLSSTFPRRKSGRPAQRMHHASALRIGLGLARLSRELSQALMEPILGQFNITTRQTMANSSKNPNADDRGPPDQSFVSHGTRWKKKSMDGAAGAEVQRARADWRPYGIFAHALPRHHFVP